jgi:hypothetical protein
MGRRTDPSLGCFSSISGPGRLAGGCARAPATADAQMFQARQTCVPHGAGFIVAKCKINYLVRIEMIRLKFIMMASGPSVGFVAVFIRPIRITVRYAAV